MPHEEMLIKIEKEALLSFLHRPGINGTLFHSRISNKFNNASD